MSSCAHRIAAGKNNSQKDENFMLKGKCVHWLVAMTKCNDNPISVNIERKRKTTNLVTYTCEVQVSIVDSLLLMHVYEVQVRIVDSVLLIVEDADARL